MGEGASMRRCGQGGHERCGARRRTLRYRTTNGIAVAALCRHICWFNRIRSDDHHIYADAASRRQRNAVGFSDHRASHDRAGDPALPVSAGPVHRLSGAQGVVRPVREATGPACLVDGDDGLLRRYRRGAGTVEPAAARRGIAGCRPGRGERCHRTERHQRSGAAGAAQSVFRLHIHERQPCLYRRAAAWAANWRTRTWRRGAATRRHSGWYSCC